MQKVKIDTETGCWVYTGYVDRYGYGQMVRNRKHYAVHRFVYERLVGPIPEGLQLDHLCHDETCPTPGNKCPHRRCCNPDHLKPATRLENCGRGVGQGNPALRAKTHCPKGHSYEGDNLKLSKTGGRSCRTCQIEAQRAWRRKKATSS
jgi:hypothetical protein